jgi:hypothetical protein
MSLKPFPMLGSRCCPKLAKDCSFGVRNVPKNALVIGSSWGHLADDIHGRSEQQRVAGRPTSSCTTIYAVMNSELEKKTRRSLD